MRVRQALNDMKTRANNDRCAPPRRHLRWFLLAGVVVAALALASCTAGEQDALLLDSVPADAVMLGSVQPQRALGDSNVRDALDQLLGLLGDKTLDDALAQVDGASGVDLAAVEQVLVFQAAEQEGAVLVAGTYDAEKIKETAEEKAGSLAVTAHRGHDLYTAGEGKTFAFLEDDVLLVGALESAKAVIDVRAGEAAAPGRGAAGFLRRPGRPSGEALHPHVGRAFRRRPEGRRRRP